MFFWEGDWHLTFRKIWGHHHYDLRSRVGTKKNRWAEDVWVGQEQQEKKKRWADVKKGGWEDDLMERLWLFCWFCFRWWLVVVRKTCLEFMIIIIMMWCLPLLMGEWHLHHYNQHHPNHLFSPWIILIMMLSGVCLSLPLFLFLSDFFAVSLPRWWWWWWFKSWRSTTLRLGKEGREKATSQTEGLKSNCSSIQYHQWDPRSGSNTSNTR